MSKATRILSVVLIVIIGLILFLTFYFYKDSYELIPIPIKKMIAKEDWAPFYSDRDKFTVAFPSYPKYTSERVPGLSEEQKHEYGVYESLKASNGNQALFMVTVISFFHEKGVGNPTLLLERVVNGIVASDKGNKLVNLVKDPILAPQTIDFFIEKEGMRSAYRLLLHGSNLYLLGYLAPTAIFSEADYFHFRDSFHTM